MDPKNPATRNLVQRRRNDFCPLSQEKKKTVQDEGGSKKEKGLMEVSKGQKVI
jgi:hypothetical protein